MNICAARGRQARSFVCVGKSDKRTDALWYPGHLMWSKLSNTKAGGFGKPKTTHKLKHRKRKVCIEPILLTRGSFPWWFIFKTNPNAKKQSKTCWQQQGSYLLECIMVASNLRKCPTELKWCRRISFGTNQSKPSFSEMWALLVLTFAVAVGASEKVENQTTAKEKLVIARGKLLVSRGDNRRTNSIWSRWRNETVAAISVGSQRGGMRNKEDAWASSFPHGAMGLVVSLFWFVSHRFSWNKTYSCFQFHPHPLMTLKLALSCLPLPCCPDVSPWRQRSHNLEYDSSEDKNPRLIFYNEKDEVVKVRELEIFREQHNL